jgi:hypothetical protein
VTHGIWIHRADVALVTGGEIDEVVKKFGDDLYERPFRANVGAASSSREANYAKLSALGASTPRQTPGP